MATQRNKAALEAAYVSFAEGDPEPFIARIAPQAQILYFGPMDKVPWAGRYQGPEGYKQLVARITDHSEIHEFTANAFIADGDQIMVLGIGRGLGKNTRRPFELNWAHYFRFQSSMIRELRIYNDTASIAKTLADE